MNLQSSVNLLEKSIKRTQRWAQQIAWAGFLKMNKSIEFTHNQYLSDVCHHYSNLNKRGITNERNG